MLFRSLAGQLVTVMLVATAALPMLVVVAARALLVAMAQAPLVATAATANPTLLHPLILLVAVVAVAPPALVVMAAVAVHAAHLAERGLVQPLALAALTEVAAVAQGQPAAATRVSAVLAQSASFGPEHLVRSHLHARGICKCQTFLESGLTRSSFRQTAKVFGPRVLVLQQLAQPRRAQVTALL